MITSANEQAAERVAAVGVQFEGNMLVVTLSDGREVCLPMDRIPWLRWLAEATPEQRAKWSLEPNGFAIYWDELDDGIEVTHLLAPHPLN